MKLVLKQSAVQFCILAVIGLICLVLIYFTLDHLREQYVRNVIENRFDFITDEIDASAERSIAESSLFVSLPVVAQAYEVALSGDINDPYSPQSQEAREMLRKELALMLDSYRDSIGNSLQLHFHLPNGSSLVRLWRDKNAMVGDEWVDISDDISSFRPTVMNTLRTGEISAGIEAGSGGFAIRGVIPVVAPDGRQIGSAEVLQNFDRILRAAVVEGELYLFLYANIELLEFSVDLRDSEKYPPLGDFVRVVEVVDSQLEHLVTAELLSRGKDGIYYKNSGNITLAAYPINDYMGSQVGVIVIAYNTSEISLLINAAAVALALMLASMVLVPVFTRVNRIRVRVAENQRLVAEDANKAKSAFLSTMSHEIRTPLNAILGITEIQLHNDLADTDIEDIKEAFEKIYTSGDLLLSIINDILDLSKIESGKLDLQINVYDVASLVSDTVQLNMMRVGSRKVEFELNIDEAMPAQVSGDELRVKQVLNNLLSNAFKYTSEGLVTMSVRTEDSVDNSDEIVLIASVIDTGQGMTKEQVSKLFDEYARFNQRANRDTEGTGLGMSITRDLLDLMDGKIFVESELGKGSVFTVRIPQGRVGSETLGKEIADSLRQFRSSSRAQMKRVQITREPMPYGSVLVVDDVDTNIYVAKGLLIPYQLNVDSADSGFAAIEKIKNGKTYDVIFMDHMMPVMDGIEATRKLREMGYTRPIVALTANAVAGQASIFLGNGFDDYISKPIDIRHLNNILNKHVRTKRQHESTGEESGHFPMEDTFVDDEFAPYPYPDPVLAGIFIRDALKSMDVLEEYIGKGCPDGDDLRTFIIHAHGLKSALASVGKMDISAVALKLEQWGRNGDIEAIAAGAPEFLASLKAFVGELSTRNQKAGGLPADDTEDYEV